MREILTVRKPGTKADTSCAAPCVGEEVISGHGRGYVIFALPRSRTAWLSHFLSYGEWTCGHDEIRHMRSMGDIKAWFAQDCTGTVETAAAPYWRLLDQIATGTKVVVIRRPVAEVVESLAAIPGCVFDREALTQSMAYHARKLEQIAARTNALVIDYADLVKEEVCAALFEYCLPYEHDPEHWRMMDSVNIQINMPSIIRYCTAYAPAIAKMADIARHRSFTSLAVRRPVSPDGMTFRAESFDEWLAGAEHLLAEHHAQIGESPENWRNKNIPLLRAMDEMGAMRITTARSNGRMFGYLMTLLAPSLVTENMMTAVNTAFFADPACPGLGLKLQREALSSFKEMGIGEVLWETNTVGGAERIGAIYRRLGAEEKGSVYRLRLAEAA